MFALCAPAQADDFLETEGRLSDRDFYRLVSCRAAPGKACEERLVRWSERDARALGIGLATVASDYPDDLALQMDRSIDLVISTLNGVDADLRLRRVTKTSQADIAIHLIGAGAGDMIHGTGNSEVDGTEIGAALVHIRWNLVGDIVEGTIAVASDIPLTEAYPVLLEEITQSLGLMTDIRNPYYEGRSVFSEDSNNVTKLSDQDRIAIQRHYPLP